MSSIILLVLLIMVSACTFGAINPDIVRGSYFFIQYSRPLNYANPEVPNQSFGTITFAATTFSFKLQDNNGYKGSGSGTYGINDYSHIWADNSGKFFGIINGLVSSDGSFIAGGQHESYSQMDPSFFFFAIRMPTGGMTLGDLKGTYSFIQSASYATDEMFPVFTCTSSVGKMIFDGAGNASFDHLYSTGSKPSQNLVGTGTYAVNADGSGTFTIGTLKTLLGVSADKNTFIVMSVGYPNSITFLIGMKDAPGIAYGNSRTIGPYALLRMAPDFKYLNGYMNPKNRDIPYMGLGNVTADGNQSIDGQLNEKYPGYLGEVFMVPFTRTYTVASSGKMDLRMSGSSKIVTGYQVGQVGNFLGAIVNNPDDHGIVIMFRTGPFIGNSAITDAAEFKSPVAPGSIISIFGEGLGPWRGSSLGFQPGTNKMMASAGGVSVTVNGIPCPLFFTSFYQINCQMPFEVSGQTRVSVAATSSGAISPTEYARVAPVAPALFPGAVVNAVTGRVITSTIPARPGDYLVFFATGLGQVEGGGVTGQATAGAQKVNAVFEARINGYVVPLDYAGLAPGFPGLYQINIRLPGNTPAGAATFNFKLKDDLSMFPPGFSVSFPIGN